MQTIKAEEYDEESINICPKGVYILTLCATLTNTFVLSTSGMIYSWGCKGPTLGRDQGEPNKPSQVNCSQRVIDMKSGNNHVLILDQIGYVHSWGKNEFGQLGHGNTLPLKSPKEIEFFQRSQIKIESIHCGGDSSYAISRASSHEDYKPALFSWGDNRNHQLGLTETSERYLPEQARFDNCKDCQMHYGKNNVAYFYQFEGVDSYTRNTKIVHYIKEMTEELQRLQTRILQDQQSQKQIQSQQDKLAQEDEFIRGAIQQKNSVEDQINSSSRSLDLLKEEREQLEKELNSVKDQLFQIFAKETELTSDREQIEQALRKMNNQPNKNPIEYEQKLKEQKRIKELFQSYDNIKNEFLKKKNTVEEQKIRKQEEERKITGRIVEMKELIKLLDEINSDRRIFLRTKQVESTKADLENFMKKCDLFFKTLKESDPNEIGRKLESNKSLQDMMVLSNQKLDQIRNELTGFKLNQNDENYEILVKIRDLLLDNLAVRRQTNQYLKGIVQTALDRTATSLDTNEQQKEKQIKQKQQERVDKYTWGLKQQCEELNKPYISVNKAFPLENK